MLPVLGFKEAEPMAAMVQIPLGACVQGPILAEGESAALMAGGEVIMVLASGQVTIMYLYGARRGFFRRGMETSTGLSCGHVVPMSCQMLSNLCESKAQ